MKTNRIFKDSYSIRPSTIFKKGWSLSSFEQDELHMVKITVDADSTSLTMVGADGNAISFDSHDTIQNICDNNEPFVISADFRDCLLLEAYRNSVLTYSFEDNKLLATWNAEKGETCFFTIDNDISRFKKYADLEALQGETVFKVADIVSNWSESAYDDCITGYSDSYFSSNNSENCSCRGGGCPYCSPKDFI